jgi:DNA-binding XRE family transcriptional regulator
VDARKRKRIEAAGWRVGSTAEFLGLTEAEVELIEMRFSLATKVRTWRLRAQLTQQSLARRLESSQSRVAKLEAGDPSVSLDLLVLAALAAGASRLEVAKAIARGKRLAAS